jgi:multiple sugar transport system ATP-binding protein
VAVKDLTLRVEDKSLVTLLGPSGCGKTTTLKMISGLTFPTSGEIYFDGVKVTKLRPQERKVGLVFQDYAVFPTMSGFDNIAFGLAVKGMAKSDIKKRVREIAETLHIVEVLDSMPGRMTQSELQSVALARTLVTNPSVLFLDEPLSNLDAAFRVRMRAELKRLQKEIAQTVVYVTHDQVEAMSISDKIAVMNFGALQQYGTPSEVYNHPSTRFVAGFIGSPPMNFIDCTFIDDPGSLDLGVARLDIRKIRDVVSQEATSPELILGVRPEDIMVEGKPESKESIEFLVEAYEPLGDEAIIDADLGGNLIRVTVPTTLTAEPGDRKYLRFNLDRIHIIDKKTEKVIV